MSISLIVCALAFRVQEILRCDCPYDWGGWCKHLVAVALAYLAEPQSVTQKTELSTLLHNASKSQLETALQEITRKHPETLTTLELHLSLSAASEPTERKTKVDAEPIREHIHYLAQEALESYGGYYSTADLTDLIHKAEGFLEHGDTENAFIILEAITSSAVNESAEGVYGWDYEGGDDAFDELDACWAEAILMADLNEDERDGLLTDLLAWRDELNSYGFDAFYLAEAALELYWHNPSVQAQLQGQYLDTGEASYVNNDLTDIRLKVLERQGKIEAYLNFANVKGRIAAHKAMLVKHNKIDEALLDYQQNLTSPADALLLAQALFDSDKLNEALEVAEFGLSLEQVKHSPFGFNLNITNVPSRLDLAHWLSDKTDATTNKQLAIKARQAAFEERPSLMKYQELETLATENWPSLKTNLLNTLRNEAGSVDARIDIFMHEELFKDAVKTVGNLSDHYEASIQRVMDATLTNHPEWIIDNAKARAEQIMDAKRSRYYANAALWLDKAKHAYDAQDRFDDWELYLKRLKLEHKRKYSLMKYLNEL